MLTVISVCSAPSWLAWFGLRYEPCAVAWAAVRYGAAGSVGGSVPTPRLNRCRQYWSAARAAVAPAHTDRTAVGGPVNSRRRAGGGGALSALHRRTIIYVFVVASAGDTALRNVPSPRPGCR